MTSVAELNLECMCVRYAVTGADESWSEVMAGSSCKSSKGGGPGIVTIKR